MRRALKKILDRHGTDRSELIPIIQEAQDAVGYLPPDVLRDVADHLNVPEAAVYGVVTFYPQFHLEPRALHCIRVCRGTGCQVQGSGRIRRVVERTLGIKEGETTPDKQVAYETFTCTGACAHAPVMVVDGKVHGRVTPQKAAKIIEKLK